MVGHQLREMINRLYSIAAPAPQPDGPRIKSLSDAIRNLASLWRGCWGIGDDWSEPQAWEPVSTEQRNKLLKKLHRIVREADSLHPEKQRLSVALPHLDPSPTKAAPAAYKPLLEALWIVREYFIDVAHCKIDPVDHAEFEERFNQLDNQIAAMFRTTTAEDLSALDEEIVEVERGST